MKVAIIGYGKMGRIIEKKLLERGHQVVAKFGSEGINLNELQKAEVAIEFSRPESAFENLKTCLNQSIPVVCGTTGWLKDYDEICRITEKNKTAFLYASNFSLGVNLFFALNKKLAELMSPYGDYQAKVEEIHHLQKLDAPSGTAISLAEDLIKHNANYQSWLLKGSTKSQAPVLDIEAFREQDVPGTHIINYENEIDRISIKHEAKSREGFALGAVLAAEYLIDKTGVCSMQNVLNLS